MTAVLALYVAINSAFTKRVLKLYSISSPPTSNLWAF